MNAPIIDTGKLDIKIEYIFIIFAWIPSIILDGKMSIGYFVPKLFMQSIPRRRCKIPDGGFFQNIFGYILFKSIKKRDISLKLLQIGKVSAEACVGHLLVVDLGEGPLRFRLIPGSSFAEVDDFFGELEFRHCLLGLRDVTPQLRSVVNRGLSRIQGDQETRVSSNSYG